jgi:hypothetical protein
MAQVIYRPQNWPSGSNIQLNVAGGVALIGESSLV